MLSLPNSQKGFTLMELMIAVVLGLLIVAAVTQVYVMAISTSTNQKASAGILDANVYGLQQVERSLRMAGLGLGDIGRVNSACSGILIKGGTGTLNHCGSLTGFDEAYNEETKVLSKTPKASPIANLADAMWTRADGGQASNTSAGNMPQLTIQYRAPVTMVDCEGNVALGPRQVRGESATKAADPTQQNATIAVDGQVVIERYFVRNNNGVLELRCDAGRYVLETIRADDATPEAARIIQANPAQATPANMNDDGALVISGIDDFRVQLGMRNPSTQQITYRDIAGYLADANAASSDIVSIKMGVLTKGLVATTSSNSNSGDQPSYTMLGAQITMNDGQPTNVIRRVYETNTMLRNSRGVQP